jgi:N,N'-diacetylchitobiose transport system substrate-binding protein
MAIPSATDGKTVPVFLGGSVLGIAAKSPNQAQAIDWLKQLTSEVASRCSSPTAGSRR